MEKYSLFILAILLALLAALLVLIYINRNQGSPNIAMANRWLRWIILSGGGAYILKIFNLVDRPFWLLMLCFAVGWFFLETFYNWIAIQAYSHSELPLFPQYETNTSGEEWYILKVFLRMRGEIRSAGFTHLCSIRACLFENIYMRASIYEHAATFTRLQVTFVPRPHSIVAAITTIATYTAGGFRYVTDNTVIPYAGFFPENWLVERKPRIRSVKALIAYHRRRLVMDDETPVRRTIDPLEEVNTNQRIVEQLNIRMGFLEPPGRNPDTGRITKAGLYRTWKELWTINYLGRSAKYL